MQFFAVTNAGTSSSSRGANQIEKETIEGILRGFNPPPNEETGIRDPRCKFNEKQFIIPAMHKIVSELHDLKIGHIFQIWNKGEKHLSFVYTDR